MGNILWLDDDALIIGSFRSSLRRHGHSVTHVQTAAEALHELLATEQRYDVALLDLDVPVGYPEGVQVPTDLQAGDVGWFVVHEVRNTEECANRYVWFLVCSAWFKTKSERYSDLADDERCVVCSKGDDIERFWELLTGCLADTGQV